MHVSNKPNKELISINKSVLIGLREALAWGLLNHRGAREKKDSFQIFCFLGPSPLPSTLHKALISFSGAACWCVCVRPCPCLIPYVAQKPLSPAASPPAVLPVAGGATLQLGLRCPEVQVLPCLFRVHLEQFIDSRKPGFLSCKRGSWWFLSCRVRITCW